MKRKESCKEEKKKKYRSQKFLTNIKEAAKSGVLQSQGLSSTIAQRGKRVSLSSPSGSELEKIIFKEKTSSAQKRPVKLRVRS